MARHVASPGMSTRRAGSLCTGYGGLDRAIHRLLGVRLAWTADNDPDASKVIAARHAAPNLGDIKAIDWTAIEPIDVLTAGYPCQPFSEAGKGLGADDPRHLWPFVLDAVRHLRPRLVVLENVKGHLRIGFPQVLADLAEVGFDAEWTVLRACDVGACHQRARLFVVAHPTGERRESWPGLRSGDTPEDWWRFADDDGSSTSAHTEGEQREDEPAGGDCPTLPFGAITGTSGGTRAWNPPEGVVIDRRGARVVAWGAYEPAVRRHERLSGRPAPFPLDGSVLSARFVEWMQGLPDGFVTDVVSRAAAIRLLGNGVCPPQAFAALGHLLEREQEEEVAA